MLDRGSQFNHLINYPTHRQSNRAVSFRRKVLEACHSTISSSQDVISDATSRALEDEIDTYWKNVSKEYGIQMDADKRENKERAIKKDRRRMRNERVGLLFLISLRP